MSVYQNKDAEQLHSYNAADLCFALAYAKSRLSRDMAHLCLLPGLQYHFS